ncbi:MAG: hypothetical protein Q8M00_03070 [bacterium]|nr:hypothetical protein [bacterium]
MKIKPIIIFLIILIAIGGGAFFILSKTTNGDNFKTEREKVLSQLYLAIEKAKAKGKYQCCIEPPCTMCYLGNWIWDDGTCHCDEMIAKGEWNKVCPQCIRGIEEGRCKSEADICPLPKI